MILPGRLEPVRDPAKVVTVAMVSRRPPVWRISCSCRHFSIEVGEQIHGLELWEIHAGEAGHEGDFGVVVSSGH